MMEILIVSVIAVIVLLFLYKSLISGSRVYRVTTENMLVNEQARQIINYLNYELRRANIVELPPLIEDKSEITEDNSHTLRFWVQRVDPSRDPAVGKIYQQTKVELEVRKAGELFELVKKKTFYDYDGNADISDEEVLFRDIEELSFWRFKYSKMRPQSGPKVVHFNLKLKRQDNLIDKEQKYMVDFNSAIYVRGEKII